LLMDRPPWPNQDLCPVGIVQSLHKRASSARACTKQQVDTTSAGHAIRTTGAAHGVYAGTYMASFVRRVCATTHTFCTWGDCRLVVAYVNSSVNCDKTPVRCVTQAPEVSHDPTPCCNNPLIRVLQIYCLAASFATAAGDMW
jgi:hypothetical protein